VGIRLLMEVAKVRNTSCTAVMSLVFTINCDAMTCESFRVHKLEITTQRKVWLTSQDKPLRILTTRLNTSELLYTADRVAIAIT